MDLKKALKKTRNKIGNRIKNILGRRDPESLREIEDILIQADFGVKTVDRIIEILENVIPSQYYSALEDKLIQMLENDEWHKGEYAPPVVELYVGVNGVGKTTTIGKRGWMLEQEGNSVLLASGDTYRTGAVEQLSIWADRIGADIVKSQYGADAASVVYDAVDSAMSRDIDHLLVDTAGRLHTRSNLMEEMKKIKKVLEKKREDLPQETIIVVDATTGQNAFQQAKTFDEKIGLTGVALTKMDGTARGGIVISIMEELEIPVRFIGVGEEKEDLIRFKAEDFVNAIFE